MIKTDSRKIKNGDIFIAIRGNKRDGHDYIEEAIKNGAIKIICEEGSFSVETEIVPNTKEYLKKYVKENYNFVNEMTIIGVTGTNGKTTISYLLYQALNKSNIKCSMIGTLGYFKNEKIEDLPNTCPELTLTYEKLIDSYNSGYRCVVIEASSQGLEEDRLYNIKFDYAIFTNLTHDHLDFHKNMENYVASKEKLFRNLKENGVGIVNIDDKYSKFFNCTNRITYGFNKSDYKVEEYSDYCFTYNGKKINHNLIGKYNIYNLLACIIVLEKMNVPNIKELIKELKSPNGRMELYEYKNNKIIIDYAHTPDAMKQVMNSFSNYNKMYVVFGCTGNRDKSKRPRMMSLATKKCDLVIVTSDDLYYEDFKDIVIDMIDGAAKLNYVIEKDRKEAIKKGIKLLKDNDILLILGKGHEKVIKIKGERIPFNDGKTVESLLKNLYN